MSKATGPGATSGAPRSACSTPPWRRRSGAGARIAWHEVLAGEKAFNATREWMPAATLDAFRKYLVGIKGPLTTPVGGGIRSLNVALRQELDLYVCLRPVRWFKGVPEPREAPAGRGHGDLPGEHRGHLRRHRVGGGDTGGAEGHRSSSSRR